MKTPAIIIALLGAMFSNQVLATEASMFDGVSGNTDTAQNINTVKSEVSEAKESVDGMRSVIDGLSANNQKLNVRLSDMESTLTNDISAQIEEIKKAQAEQNERLDKLTEAVTALGAALQSKSTTNSKNSNSKSTKKNESKVNNTASTDDFKSMPQQSVVENAEKDFKAKKYERAKAAFEYLVEKSYKPAYSNYMLGEIEYANKRYKNAIPYYRASVNLYDKGNYMPRLLYHTAISCDKIGDVENANKFYSALKASYPNSEEAKASPTRN